MARVYNFSAGPAVLPEEVLKEAADEMLDYQGSGQSVMEMSHRSKVYDNIIKEAEADLRELMNIPDNYKVLFLQDSGQRKLIKKLRFTVKPLQLLHLRIRHSRTYRIVRIWIFRKMPIMFTSVKTIQFMVQNLRLFQTQRDICLYRMFHPVSYLNRLM